MPEAGGALEVEVHAWEAVGLLAGVLGRVARAGLVPDAIALETEGECAFHLLRLRRRDLGPPRARHQRKLSRDLGALVRGG